MEKTQVFEWTIKNISCWREKVHEETIKSPDFVNFGCFPYVELLPRGVIADFEDPMAVFISPINCDFTGDLTFIGSDGSEMCTLGMSAKKGEIFKENGPKLDDVASLKGADQLTLRFSFPSDHYRRQLMCTTLDVINVNLKIDPKFIQTLKTEYIYFISYGENKDCEGLTLQVVRSDESVEFLLDPADKTEKHVWFECCVSLLQGGRVLARQEKKEHLFLAEEPWTFSEPLQVDELVVKGIDIHIDGKIINGIATHNYNHRLYCSEGVTVESIPQRNDPKAVLLSDITKLYQNSDFSDFVLKCDGSTFPVHRNILSARSPFFKSLFSSGMRESLSGCMDIVDMDPTTLSCYLKFLYSGAMEDLEWESALQLYYVSDKYFFPALKKKCVQFLSSNISASNVSDLSLLLDQHQEEELSAAVHNFQVVHE